MSTLIKVYMLFGALIAMITKFPPFSWENFLTIICIVILLAIFKVSCTNEKSLMDQMRDEYDDMEDKDERF